jgi:hypothetical protein
MAELYNSRDELGIINYLGISNITEEETNVFMKVHIQQIKH